MRFFVQLLAVVVATVCLYSSCCGTEFEDELEDEEDKWPTIGVSILVKNKAHSLPYALTCLEQLHYPKERLYFWFYIDSTSDDSEAIISAWTKKYKAKYGNIYVTTQKPAVPPTSKGATDTAEWTEERLKHIIQLREKALNFGRKRWADYIFMLDADVILTDPMTLKTLVRKNLPIVAPMLVSDGLYSNFWGAMSKKYYYEKSEMYEKINNHDVVGCFQVPMVHSAVLIDLRTKASDLLSYDPAKVKNYEGPVDDIIAFAISAVKNDIVMSVCNDRLYGFLPVPVDMNHTSMKTSEVDQLVNVKMEALSRGVAFPVDPALAKFVTYPPRDRLGFDRVYMINLERRTERRRLMEHSFKELGVDAVTVTAVDGRLLDLKDLSKISVTLMPKYEDPYHKRPMKAGEVGCFLSHYLIWKEIAKKNLDSVLVLEDDIRFTPFFRRKLQELMKDLESIDWEFVYIGRKVLLDGEEEVITPRLTRPLYSYWTLGYLISQLGARKLIQAEPLAKMLPVDEFLPIMFDQHPNETWKQWFPRRDLKAFSATPLLVHPTHYTGQEGYVSDTEDSHVLAPAVEAEDVTRHGHRGVPNPFKMNSRPRPPPFRDGMGHSIRAAICLMLIIFTAEIVLFFGYVVHQPQARLEIYWHRLNHHLMLRRNILRESRQGYMDGIAQVYDVGSDGSSDEEDTTPASLAPHSFTNVARASLLYASPTRALLTYAPARHASATHAHARRTPVMHVLASHAPPSHASVIDAPSTSAPVTHGSPYAPASHVPHSHV